VSRPHTTTVPSARTAELLRRLADADANNVADSPAGGAPRPYFGSPQPAVRPVRVCVTVKVSGLAKLPVTVIVAVRVSVVAFAPTVKTSSASPVPETLEPSSTSHAASDVAVQLQLPEESSLTADSPPAALMRRSS